MKTMFALATVLLAAACGGGSKDVDAQLTRIDARPTVDSPIVTTCAAEASYGTLTLPPEQMLGDVNRAGTPEETDDTYFLIAQPGTGEGEFGDIFQLQLYAGFGVFPDTVVEGTYTIAGDEANFATCGVCGLMFADTADDGTGSPDLTLADLDRNYFATAGTVEITAVPEAVDADRTLSGTITNMTLEHVTIDTNTFQSTVVGDCTTTITSFAFTAQVTEPAAAPGTLTLNIPALLRKR